MVERGRGGWARGAWVLLLLWACGDDAATGVAPDLSLSPERLEWPATWVGETSQASARLSNLGAATARVDAVEVTGAAFELAGPAPERIPPGGGAPLPVRFRPVRDGAAEGVLRVTSGTRRLEVALRATAKAPPLCDDANPCTDDAFDAVAGVCEHAPRPGPCEDGSLCTEADRCVDGVCLGRPVDCDDRLACTLDGCEPSAGCLHAPAPGLCDDGNPCTAERCAADGACAWDAVADGTVCGAVEACALEVCRAGACVVEALPEGLSCGDATECRAEVCRGGACAVALAPEGLPCDDGIACTAGDACASGVCVGTGAACGWVDAAAGGSHTVALREDGSLWAWGSNFHGQLGLGDAGDDQPFPVRVGTRVGWLQVAAGGSHTVALREDGTLWAWGRNHDGQLGLGDRAPRTLPTQVGTDADWTAVSVGKHHALALKADGTLWAWGGGPYGALGLGDLTLRVAPEQVGTDADWLEVSAGPHHTLALKADGTLWAWGHNLQGELGLGEPSWQKASPVRSGDDADWIHVAAGDGVSAALKADGTLWVWGNNQQGILGAGGAADEEASPVRVGTDADWAHVSAADCYFLAVKADGTLWAWGIDFQGRLGLGTPSGVRTAPVRVGRRDGWVRASAATGYYGSHAVALRADGTLWAWGHNAFGQLGLGYRPHRSVPEPLDVGAGWVSVEARHSVAMALKADGTLWAWGDNGLGQLGLGDTLGRAFPEQVGAWDDWSRLAVGEQHVLGIRADGSLWAWGSSSYGRLGLGDVGYYVLVPTRVGESTDWSAVSAGDHHSLALRTDGTLWAWGENYVGQLGLGASDDRSMPTQVGTDADWVAISAGGYHSMALKADGSLWAWGYGARGQRGIPGSSSVPEQVGDATDWRAVGAGDAQTLGVRADGSLWSWGSNDVGQLGLGDLRARETPQRVGTGSAWAAVSASRAYWGHCHALRDDGTVASWGLNRSGELGLGDTTWRFDGDGHLSLGAEADRSSPAPVGEVGWAVVAAGSGFTVGVKTDGTLWSWGYGEGGHLGDGGTTVPRQVVVPGE